LSYLLEKLKNHHIYLTSDYSCRDIFSAEYDWHHKPHSHGTAIMEPGLPPGQRSDGSQRFGIVDWVEAFYDVGTSHVTLRTYHKLHEHFTIATHSKRPYWPAYCTR
jgi:hypothetical protein